MKKVLTKDCNKKLNYSDNWINVIRYVIKSVHTNIQRDTVESPVK